MVKKENPTGLHLVAIISIVAVVGLIILVSGYGKANLLADLTGQAYLDFQARGDALGESDIQDGWKAVYVPSDPYSNWLLDTGANSFWRYDVRSDTLVGPYSPYYMWQNYGFVVI